MKLNTVNVIEYRDDAVFAAHSFTDDEIGNKEAEELFSKCAKDNGAADEDLEACIEDGWYESGTYQVFLTHAFNY